MLTLLFPDLSANIVNFASSGGKAPDISQQTQQHPGNLDLAVLTRAATVCAWYAIHLQSFLPLQNWQDNIEPSSSRLHSLPLGDG